MLGPVCMSTGQPPIVPTVPSTAPLLLFPPSLLPPSLVPLEGLEARCRSAMFSDPKGFHPYNIQ